MQSALGYHWELASTSHGFLKAHPQKTRNCSQFTSQNELTTPLCSRYSVFRFYCYIYCFVTLVYISLFYLFKFAFFIAQYTVLLMCLVNVLNWIVILPKLGFKAQKRASPSYPRIEVIISLVTWRFIVLQRSL